MVGHSQLTIKENVKVIKTIANCTVVQTRSQRTMYEGHRISGRQTHLTLFGTNPLSSLPEPPFSSPPVTADVFPRPEHLRLVCIQQFQLQAINGHSFLYPDGAVAETSG